MSININIKEINQLCKIYKNFSKKFPKKIKKLLPNRILEVEDLKHQLEDRTIQMKKNK